MTFLSPLAFILLALIPPIIALYLLKLRRQDYEVSSVYLWQRFVRDVEANAPWQRLRRNLLLLLQILFLLLLIFALVRPATPAAGIAGQSVVLILDNSASMAATDIEGQLGGNSTRLVAAKRAATEIVTNLPDSARVTVIAAAGGRVDLLTSATQDPRQALQAIDSIPVTPLNSDLSPALTLAEAIIAREASAEVILLSDGVIDLPQTGMRARLMPIGVSSGNQAITTLSVSTSDDGQLALFIQVSNYGSEAVQRRLVVTVDDAPAAAIDLELPPGGHVEQLIEAIPAEAETIEATLQPSDQDALPLDDQAWLVVRSADPAQATLVTSGNYFLQTALSLLDGRRIGAVVETTTIDPESWLADSADASESETSAPPTFHIFDRTVPETLPPGNLLFIAPSQAVTDLFEISGQIDTPQVEVVGPDHPLLQNSSLADTQILATQVISAGDWARTVVAGYAESSQTTADAVPLLLAGEVDGRRVVILAFDLHQSDLPLRPAFPILIANLVRYLAPGAGGIIPPQAEPGQALTLNLPAETEQVQLTYPDGQIQPITPNHPPTQLSNQPPTQPTIQLTNHPTIQPTQLGLYTLEFASPGDQNRSRIQFAVNFFNPAESAIAPRPELTLTTNNSDDVTQAELPPAHQEWWRPLAAGALFLLVAEWFVYRRGVIARWWSRVKR